MHAGKRDPILSSSTSRLIGPTILLNVTRTCPHREVAFFFREFFGLSQTLVTIFKDNSGFGCQLRRLAKQHWLVTGRG